MGPKVSKPPGHGSKIHDFRLTRVPRDTGGSQVQEGDPKTEAGTELKRRGLPLLLHDRSRKPFWFGSHMLFQLRNNGRNKPSEALVSEWNSQEPL